MGRSVPATLRYGPHVAIASVGYVTFCYAAVPSIVVEELGIGFAEFGLLTSAPLLAYVFVQPLASRLVGRHPAARVLLWSSVLHGLLSVALAVPAAFPLALALRVAWGSCAGVLLSAGATHLARLHRGATATGQQGLYGGSLTLGGALAFLVAPRLAPLVGGGGSQLLGAPLVLPAVVGLWVTSAAPTAPTGGDGESTRALSVLTAPAVVVAALGYVATIGAYVTLSTFVTAYFDELGVVGPLSAVVLLTASAGRAAGATVLRRRVGDLSLVAVAAATATAAFALLASGPGRWLVILLPLVGMLAVSVPFGGIYTLAAAATDREGTALAAVVGAGNVAAFVLPFVTGALRDATGTYRGGFVLLAALNAVTVVGAVLLARHRR